MTNLHDQPVMVSVQLNELCLSGSTIAHNSDPSNTSNISIAYNVANGS